MNSTAPRRFLSPGVLLAVLIPATLLVVAAARFSAPAAAPAAADDIRQSRVLRFDDLPDGAVAAIDMRDGTLVQRFEGEQGFLRGTLRAMARERMRHSAGRELPFELLLHADGRLTLHDPATGMNIALESFGSTNTGVFARLLR